MSYRSLLTACAAVAVFAATLPQPVTAATASTAGRKTQVQKAMEDLAMMPGVVGAIGGVYVDGKPAGQGSAGSRLLDGKGGAIPANARYRIGSQTKEMVATVLLQLVDKGLLSLDDKLGDLLPELVDKDLVERANEITVHQLLRHTSGIPDWYTDRTAGGRAKPLVDVFDFTTHYRPIDLVTISRARARTNEPGEKFSYSNTNYTLIEMIIQKVTGHPLATELHQRIFGPLKMTKTYLATKPGDGIKGPHGHGYYPDGQGKLRDVDRFNGSYGAGAGGVISTTQDLSAFKRALAQGELLPPHLRRVMTDPLPGQTGGQAGGLCGGKLKGGASGGSIAGYNTMTYASHDGRVQFAMSVTLSIRDTVSTSPALIKSIESVLCPVT
ncbi:serine hydrolase domain-containing protein [Nonomuraea ceibae]|uniref:serine hydrolase domain-containing protein n=1 Tax=Nonomuraea ceibae TaxID=1935170 RepID=UPI001C603301|nr:serine hydrolase domain-containing protein [Nonomuraea ceibae]